MSLCFREAMIAKSDRKSGVGGLQITEEEYFCHLIAHFRGVRHPADSDEKDGLVSSLDPVGASIREMALSTDYEPLKDTTLYEKLFCSCRTGSVDSFRSNFKQLVEQSLPIPLQPLATLAASKGHSEILQLCLDEGAVFDSYLDRTAEYGATSVEMLNVLFTSNWRNIQNSQEAMDDLVACCVGEESSLLTWLFDRGARVNERTVRNAAVGPTSIPTMAMLIEKCGLAPLTNQGALQFAAYYGKLDMVQFLLDAGAGIDDISPEQDIREGGPYTALYEAVRGQRVDIVRFLLDRGAKVNIACRGDETALQAATRLGYREIVELIEEKKKSSRYPVD